MNVQDLIAIARAGAQAASVSEALVCAMCEHESGGWNPVAVRVESRFYVKYVMPLRLIDINEAWGRAQSWGLMQPMGQLCREEGYTGAFVDLLTNPALSVKYGCIKLKRCIFRHPGDMDATLLEYNGGKNPQYPSSVTSLVSKYQSK